MAGIFGEFFLVFVSHETKHEESSKNSGKIRSKIRGNIRDENSKIRETFVLQLSWPRIKVIKQQFWTIFLSAPKAPHPQKQQYYFYCRLAVSEILWGGRVGHEFVCMFVLGSFAASPALSGPNRAMQPRCAMRFESHTPKSLAMRKGFFSLAMRKHIRLIWNHRKMPEKRPAKILRCWPAMRKIGVFFKTCSYLTCFHADFGKEFPSRTLSRVFTETAPLRSLPLCPFLYRTEHYSSGEKKGKSAEKRRGRGVASKRGKKEKRTRENRSVIGANPNAFRRAEEKYIVLPPAAKGQIAEDIPQKGRDSWLAPPEFCQASSLQ